MIGLSGLVFNPLMYRNLGYNPEKDLAPVTGMVLMHSVFTVNSPLPVHNLKELVAYTYTNPGKLNFGSFGEGNPGHLLLELMKSRAGLDFVHVPYKGAGPVIQAALSNEVQIIYMAIGAILPHIKAGKVRPVVVSGENRSRFLPDVPTFVEEGYDVRPQPWFGLFVPAQTPRPIINRIQADARRVLLNPVFQEKVLFPQFYEPVGNTPEEFNQFLQRQRAEAAELVRISGIKPVDM
jgi:tripartite-type tricarboxylate transporter receptor subunit TctC